MLGLIRRTTASSPWTTVFGQQARGYKKHMGDCNFELAVGRSCAIQSSGQGNFPSASKAYHALKQTLFDEKLREIVRLQSRFESKGDKRRRKSKEAQWRIYKEEVHKRICAGLHAKNRHDQEFRELRYQIRHEFNKKKDNMRKRKIQ